MSWLGALLIGIPFAFAGLRAFSTGTDFRYVWIALAAAVAAAAVLRYPGRNARPSATEVAVALVSATAAASTAGFILGARSVASVLFVAFGFAICESGGVALVRRAR